MVSVGPPLGVDPAGKMRLRIPNKQTKKYNMCTVYTVQSIQNDTTRMSSISILNPCIPLEQPRFLGSHLYFSVMSDNSTLQAPVDRHTKPEEPIPGSSRDVFLCLF